MEQTFAEWKDQASKHALLQVGISDLWADDDPYDLKEVAVEAYNNKQDAKGFVFDQFQEDISRNTYDAELAAQAASEEDDEDEDDYYDVDEDEDEDDYYEDEDEDDLSYEDDDEDDEEYEDEDDEEYEDEDDEDDEEY